MITIHKTTQSTVKLAIFNNSFDRIPVNLLDHYIDFIAVIVDEGRALIEKSYFKNGIKLESLDKSKYNYDCVIVIPFKPEDTEALNVNPVDEEKIRHLEIFGINKQGKPVAIFKDVFYLEGLGYYVKSLQ